MNCDIVLRYTIYVILTYQIAKFIKETFIIIYVKNVYVYDIKIDFVRKLFVSIDY